VLRVAGLSSGWLREWPMGEPKFLGSTPIPPFERAMKGRWL